MTKRVNKFNHAKRLVLAVAVSISAIGLVGCGDGGSGTFGVGGSGAAANAQVVFDVNNTSGYDIKTVQIVDKSGQQLLQGDLSCAKESKCEFKATMAQPGMLKFYDSKSTLIGVYSLSQAPESSQYVKPSSSMLGMYVFDGLRKQYPETPESLIGKINHLFANYQSADGRPDKFQELGQYYRLQMVGTGLSEKDFFSDLHKKLDSGETLPKNLIKPQSSALVPKAKRAVMAVQTGAGYECPSVISDMFSVIEQTTSFIPGVGGLFEMGKIACDNSRTDKAIKDIGDQLSEIQKNLNTMQVGLDKLISFEAMNSITSVLTTTNDVIKDATLHKATYKDLIKDHGSFRAFVDANGGIEKAWKSHPKMQEVLKNLHTDWTLLSKVGESTRKDSLVRALKLYCEDSDSPVTDWVVNRRQCNGAIAYYQSQIASTYLTELAKLRDITSTLQAYWEKEKTFIDKNVTMPEPKSNWSDEYQQVILPGLQKGLELAKGGFAPATLSYPNNDNAYFRLTAGLPEALVTRLADSRLNCLVANGAGKSQINIVGWLSNGSNSYITTMCADVSSGQTFKSRYYLKNGNEPINLMGVLLPSAEEFFYADNDFMYISGRRTSVDEGFVNIPNDWATYTADNDLRTITQNKNGLSIGSGTQSSSVRFAPRHDLNLNKVFYTSMSGYPKCDNCGGSISRIYMRKTDASSGLSSVGALYASRYMSSTLRFQMKCINDAYGCDADTGTQHALTFKNGIKIEADYVYESGTFDSTDTIKVQFK